MICNYICWPHFCRNDTCANVEDAATGALTIEESTADTNLTKKKRRSSRNEVESDMGSQSESHFEVTVTDIVDADHSRDTAIEMETDVKLHSDVTADREAGEQLSINNHIGMEDMDITGDPKENSLLENTIVTDNFILSSIAKEFVTEILPETDEIKIEQQCPADQKCTSSLDHSDVITKTDSTDNNHIIESDSAELKENDSLVKNKMNISSDDIVNNDTCVPTEYIDNESSLGTKDDIQQLEKKEQAQKQINLVQDDTPITLDISQSNNVHNVSDFNKVDGKSVGLFTHVNEKATLQKPITDSSEKSDEDLSSLETNLKLSVRKDEEKTDHSILDVSGPSVRISDGQGVSEKEKQEVFSNDNILPEGKTLVTKCEQQSIIPHEDTGLKNTNNSEVLREKNTCDGSVLDNSTSNDVLVDSKLEVEEIRKNKESNLSHPLAASDKSDVNDKLDVPNSTQQRDVANISESENNISNVLQCTSNLKTQSEKSTDEQTDFKNQQGTVIFSPPFNLNLKRRAIAIEVRRRRRRHQCRRYHLLVGTIT